MAMVIPTKANYSEEQIFLLESIDKTLWESSKSDKEKKADLQRNAGELRKSYLKRNSMIKEMVSQDLINENLAKAALELQKQEALRNEEILRLANRGFVNKAQEKYIKLKNKMTTYLDKHLVKKKWLQKVGKSLTNMAKQMGNSVWTFLKALFLLAIFDPKGKFLTSIITFITNMAVTLINVLAKHIPRIIKSMIYIITKVIPPALQRAIGAIFPAIGKMLKAWAKEIKKEFPMIGTFVEKFAELFGPKGMLTIFFKKLAGAFPIFIAAGLFFKVFFKVLPIFKSLVSLIGMLNPLTIVIAAIGASVILLKGIWDNSAKAMKKHKEETKNMGIVEEEFYKYGIGKFQPKSIGEAWDQGKRELGRKMEIFKREGMKGLWREFKNFVNIQWTLWKAIFSKIFDNLKNKISDIPKWFKKMWESIKNWVSSLPKNIAKWFKKVSKKLGKDFAKMFMPIFSPIVNVFRRIGDTLKSIFGPVFDTMGPIFEKIGKTLKTVGSILNMIWNTVINKIKGMLESVKKTFTELSNWFSGVGEFGGFDWMTMKESERSRYTKLKTEIESVTDVKGKQITDFDRLKKLFEMSAKERVKEGIKPYEQKIIDQMGKQSGIYDDFQDALKKIVAQGKAGETRTNTILKTPKNWKKSRKGK
ncbi:MAG: hypothetical protein GY853_09810 [PVC group bacterium]|nr:hypothetical protein [PVC group bacterium]